MPSKLEPMAPAKTFVERLPGIVCKGHYFDVPLDYQKSADRACKKISIFAREVISVDNADRQDLPWLLFLQGGPGFQSPRPEGCEGWLKRALKDHRVLLLDQRGTGLSSPVTSETLTDFPDAQAQFEYLKHFRADSIVYDSEFIRKNLAGGEPWTILGQSYGGFCATTYLSFAPEGLQGAILTGELPPLLDGPDDVYRATYKRVIEKNQLFYARFPGDAAIVRSVVGHLQSHQVALPSGEVLSPRRFLQLGLNFGFNVAGSSMNTLHYWLERAFVQSSATPRLSYAFLTGVEQMLHFNTNPIYSLLHECLYCQKTSSNWSAERILAEFPEFALDREQIYFTGEMIYSWMFDEYDQLKPLKEVAALIAKYPDWTPIYDRSVLRANTVPTAAVIYYNDMYVDRTYSEDTAKEIGQIKVWITNEYEHDGLRQNGEHVLDRLFGMLKDDCS